MANPPEHIPADELWSKIANAKRPTMEIDFPRLGDDGKPIATMLVRVLTQEEQIVSAANAESTARRMIKEMPKREEAQRGYDDAYNNSAAVEVLFRACRKVDDTDRPFFPSTAEIRSKLTVDEVAVLWTQYLLVQSELGPIIGHMTEDEMNAWIERLGEGGSAFPLGFLSSGATSDLLMYSASQLVSLRTDKSSAGSQPDESL